MSAWWEPYIPPGEPRGVELAFYLVVIAVGIIGLIGGVLLMAGLI